MESAEGLITNDLSLDENKFEEGIEKTKKETQITESNKLNSTNEMKIGDILPSTHIVFCRVHLRRDLLKHFECTDDAVKGFDDIHINIHLCDKYIDMISQRLQSLEGSSHEIIETLIQKADNWLPNILLRKGIFLNLTNNRSEVFFWDL